MERMFLSRLYHKGQSQESQQGFNKARLFLPTTKVGGIQAADFGERRSSMFHVLVVDDDLDITPALKRALENAGFQVEVAYSGPQALEQLRQQISDLIVLDILMPHMDGIAVCQHVRSHPSLRDLPILFLTGKGSMESKAVAFEAGGDDYLTKPFDVEELVLRVRALLRRSEALSAEHPVPLLRVGGLVLDCRTFEAFTEQTEALASVHSAPPDHQWFVCGDAMTWEEALRKMGEEPSTWGVLGAFGYCTKSSAIDLPGVYQLVLMGGDVGPSGTIQIV